MKTSITHIAKQSLALFIALGAVILVASFASAQSTWSGPTASAPGGNVAAPINVGSNSQVKDGAFGSNFLIAAPEVTATTQFCLGASGTDCISSWADVGGSSGSSSGGSNSSSGSYKWGDMCRRITWSGGDRRSCDPDEYLVDVVCSDEGTGPDCNTSQFTGGYGGSLRPHGGGGYSILCCKDF